MQFPSRHSERQLGAPANSQNQSLFLIKLPAELRLEIYTLALLCPPIHMRTYNTRSNQSIFELMPPSERFPQASVIRAARLASLLLTCRRTYAEALRVLYGINEFWLWGPEEMPFLLAIPGGPFVTRLRFIATMTEPPVPATRPGKWLGMLKKERPEHKRWMKTCQAIKRFENLRWLNVVLFVPFGWTWGWRDQEEEIFMPFSTLLAERTCGELDITWVPGENQRRAAEDVLPGWTIRRGDYFM